MSSAQRLRELLNKEKSSDSSIEVIQDTWRMDIANLYTTITQWLEEEDIHYRIQPMTFTEAIIGEYNSSILIIEIDDYEATIKPLYNIPVGKASGALMKSGKSPDTRVQALEMKAVGGVTRWWVSRESFGRELTKDSFFDALINIFGLDEGPDPYRKQA